MVNIDWTAELLIAALEKYVLKRKLVEKDKELIRKQVENVKNFDAQKVIGILLDNSEGRLDIYGPADCLLKDLEVLLKCPNNCAYFRVSNGLNYETLPMLHIDTKGKYFVSKTDIFLIFYRFLISSDHFSTDKEILALLLKSHGNRIYRKLSSCFEIVPHEIALEILKTFASELTNSSQKCNFNLTNYTTDEVGWNLSKFYDIPNDEKLLQQLKNRLIALNTKIPIRLNMEFYKNLHSDHVMLAETIKSILAQFPFVFQPFNAKLKNSPFYPIIRVFTDDKVFESSLMTTHRRFVMAKDLEVATRNRIRIKTSKQDGILLTIPESEMKPILENSGFNIDDFHVFEFPIFRTSRNIAAPIITPFGTYCKLAVDAFNDVMEVFTTDFRWFDTVVVKHIYKINKFFEDLSQIFDCNVEGSYFVETKKIDEMIAKAYKDFEKFTSKPAYDFPRDAKFSSLEEIEQEMKKYNPNYFFGYFKNIIFLIPDFFSKPKPYTKKDAIRLYHEVQKRVVCEQSQKLDKFFLRQIGIFEAKKSIDELRNSSNVPGKNELKVRELERMKVHLISYSKELKYYITLKPVNTCLIGISLTLDIYDNDTCLKNTLDETIKNYPECEAIFGLIYEAENRKSMNSKNRKHFFCLTENDVEDFCKRMTNEFNEIVENIKTSEAMNLEKMGKFYWKEQFPMDEYPHVFHEKMKEMQTNFGELLKICVEARKFFWKCFEEMKSLKNFYRMNKKRRIVMRIMSEMRVEDQKEWHLFSDDVLEAIEIVLEEENRLDAMKEKLEKWGIQWKHRENYTTVPVKLFETILDILQIDKSRFLLVPDIQFCKNMVEMPLKMSYTAMKILSPDGREVYHQAQAQYLIFQYGACDVLWLENFDSSKIGHKTRVLMEMASIGKGYTLAEKIDEAVERVKYSEVAQKTPLTLLHGKSYYDRLTKKHVDQCKKYLEGFVLDETNWPLVYHIRVSYLRLWLFIFLHEIDDEIRKNVWKAATVSHGSIRLKSMKDFEAWIDPTVPEFMDRDLLNFCIKQAHSINVYKAGNDERPYIEKHYLFDDSDALGSFGSKQRVKKVVENNKNEIYDKCWPLVPKIVEKVSDEDIESVDNLWPVIQNVIMEEFDEEEAMEMCEVLPKLEEFETMKKKVVEILKRKKIDESEKKVKAPKVVTKYVTEMKIIENCEKCRSIEKESREFTRISEDFEKEKEENKKIISRKDEDLIMLKNQISQNKMQYREEIQKFKEDVENRDLKIEQLQKEIKEHREDSRIERENLCAEFRQSSRKLNESVKKMRIELENAKLEEKTRNKRIIDLSAENGQLKTRLEIAEENLAGILGSREESENRRIPLLRRFLDPEEILRFDVYTILDKIDANSRSFDLPCWGSDKFREKYDVYIRNLEEQNCWTTTEISYFPIPFSAEFMRDYERCLKRKV